MAYTGGLYSTASSAAALETQRFRDFQTQVDEMSAREREAAMRQQQAAMDRQYAGLVTPGTAQGFTGAVKGAPAEAFPNKAGLAPQTLGTPLVAPPAANPLPSTTGTPTPAPAPDDAATPAPAATESWIGTTPVSVKLPNTLGEFVIPVYGDPNSTTAFDRGKAKAKAEQQFGFVLNKVRNNWDAGIYGNPSATTIGSVYGYFSDTGPEADARTKSYAVSEWLNSPETEQLMRTNKAAFDEIVANPAKAYDKYANQLTVSTEGNGDLPGAAPAAPDGAPANTTVQLQQAAPVAANTPVAAASATKLEKEFLPRADAVQNVVVTERGQALIKRATELGVDPAAAMAVYGIESNFGQTGGSSNRGAVGGMQVKASEWPNFQKWFTNPANISQYNIPTTLVELARTAPADSLDAGLLRLKYNELVGVPKNLWGAAYQASAEEVRDAGRPLSIDDGNLTNSDYNNAYVSLYNEATKYVGLQPSVAASPATNVTYNLARYDREHQEFDRNYQTGVATLKTQYDQVAQQRSVVAQQLQFAQQSGFYNRIPDLQRQLERIDAQIMGVNSKANELNSVYRTGIEDLNLKRLNEYSTMAVFNMRNGDGGPLSQMWSRATGQDIQLQADGQGGFNIYVNGKLDRPNVPAASIEENFKLTFDQAYRQQQAEIAQKRAEEQFKADNEMAKVTLQQMGAIEVAKIGQMKEFAPGWGTPQALEDANGAKVGFLVVGTGGNAGKIMQIKLKPGEEIKPGLKTADSFDITVRSSVGLTNTQQ